MQKDQIFLYYTLLFYCFTSVIHSKTDPNDLRIIKEFKNGLENPEILDWPEKDNDPCGNKWKNIYCSNDRITQIQVQNFGLKGKLPNDFNQLNKLVNLGFQRNNFYGKLPSFSGLSELKYLFLDNNKFDEIPLDFFNGLINIQVIALDFNPLNVSNNNGWFLPNDVGKLTQLVNFSAGSSNLAGKLPEFLGVLPNLNALKLAYNNLSGFLPMSFNQSVLQILELNDQLGEGFSGSIRVITTMPYLSHAWLHGNKFSGIIPSDIANLSALRDLNLNGNMLVGTIPEGLALLELDRLDISNNLLMGSIPKFKCRNVSYDSNSFCVTVRGAPCAPQVNALIDFLAGVNYPKFLASQWSGNDPCDGPWLGVSCDANSDVIVVNLPNRHLNGTLSPSLGKLGSLRQIRLGINQITDHIPVELTKLKSLTMLDVSHNNFVPPVPKFRAGVSLLTIGNPLLVENRSSSSSIAPVVSPPVVVQSPLSPTLHGPSSVGSVRKSPSVKMHPSGIGSKHSSRSSSDDEQTNRGKSKRFTFIIVVAGIAGVVVLALLMILFYIFCCKKKNKATVETPGSVVVHPRDSYDQNNVVKVAISSNNTGRLFTQTASSGESRISSGVTNSHVIESGNLVISVQVLRKVTNNFAEENLLGRGGFGAVYKGELADGTKIAVKRMEAGVINSKHLDEFQAEIAVLSKVRHRHLVSLFGYATEGNERLLVYEYLPQGALSKHLFHWKGNNMEPLSWKKRLSIALDVAKGMEYLHTLAQQSFIHRDLKSSNILLDENYRAKVSDFGLVKLAPDKEKSVATRLAGTFGYLAPEYAVTGKITTKVDVFSYGVVLMELLTGLVALDEDRSEESRYLAEWFWRIKSNKDTLLAAIDPTLNIKDDTFEIINIIADLAGHCTSRDPNHRPDMGHAVNVLSPLVDKWMPFSDETDDYLGIDYSQPLKEMLQGWQKEAGESKDNSCCTSLDDSRGSIPARPTGFADSFTSADAR